MESNDDTCQHATGEHIKCSKPVVVSVKRCAEEGAGHGTQNIEQTFNRHTAEAIASGCESPRAMSAQLGCGQHQEAEKGCSPDMPQLVPDSDGNLRC